MITDEQARAAAERIRDDGDDTFASTACYWESSQRDDDMRCLSEYALQELSRREQHDDGPITAEWCREQGGESCDESDCHGELLPCYRWEVGRVWVVVELWSDGVVIARVCHANWKENPTRRQLLALLAALRGEPLVSRGQMNNIGRADDSACVANRSRGGEQMSRKITAKWLESIGGVHEAGMVDDDNASVWSDGWYMFDIGHKYRWLAVSVHENEIEIHDDRPCGLSAVVTFPVKSRRSVVDLLKAFRGLAVSK